MERMDDGRRNLLVIVVFCAIIGLIGFAGFSNRNRPFAAGLGAMAPVTVVSWSESART